MESVLQPREAWYGRRSSNGRWALIAKGPAFSAVLPCSDPTLRLFQWGFDVESVKDTFREAGVPRAATSYYRANVVPGLLDALEYINRSQTKGMTVPALALNGIEDFGIRADFAEVAWEFGADGAPWKQLTRIQVPSAGHFLQHHQPAVVSEHLIEHFARNAPTA